MKLPLLLKSANSSFKLVFVTYMIYLCRYVMLKSLLFHLLPVFPCVNIDIFDRFMISWFNPGYFWQSPVAGIIPRSIKCIECKWFCNTGLTLKPMGRGRCTPPLFGFLPFTLKISRQPIPVIFSHMKCWVKRVRGFNFWRIFLENIKKWRIGFKTFKKGQILRPFQN